MLSISLVPGPGGIWLLSLPNHLQTLFLAHKSMSKEDKRELSKK